MIATYDDLHRWALEAANTVAIHRLEKAYKLEGKLEYQGLPISVETDKGSKRHWYDPNSGEKGSTTMKYPYGYIRGTLGVDGDEVDVFVGPSDTSDKVFIVTQMKKPGFKEVDEQKVMLGFTSAAAAKKAYLEHYDDSKFFGSIKMFTMDEFKEKLKSHKGKLIKHLFIDTVSANIQSVDESAYFKKGAKDMAEVEKACSHDKDDSCEKCEGKAGLFKALTARFLSVAKTSRQALEQTKKVVLDDDPILQSQAVTIVSVPGTPVRTQNVHEPLRVPIAHIQTPAQSGSLTAPDFMTSCGSCGYTHKSLSECPRCDTIRKMNREPQPIWRR